MRRLSSCFLFRVCWAVPELWLNHPGRTVWKKVSEVFQSLKSCYREFFKLLLRATFFYFLLNFCQYFSFCSLPPLLVSAHIKHSKNQLALKNLFGIENWIHSRFNLFPVLLLFHWTGTEHVSISVLPHYASRQLFDTHRIKKNKKTGNV